MIVIIDFRNFNTGGYLVCAIGAGDGGNFVLAGLDQFLDNIFADLATRLLALASNSALRAHISAEKTYPDDCNVLDMVLETMRLIAGVFLGHRGWSMIRETGARPLTANWSESIWK